MLGELKKRGINTKSELLEAIGDIPDSVQRVSEESVGDDGELDSRRGRKPKYIRQGVA